MPKKKLNSTEEKLALFLHEHEDTRYPQDDIAKLMKVSPSTISRTIKEEKYIREIQRLNDENHELRRQLNQQKISSPSETFLTISKSR